MQGSLQRVMQRFRSERAQDESAHHHLKSRCPEKDLDQDLLPGELKRLIQMTNY